MNGNPLNQQNTWLIAFVLIIVVGGLAGYGGYSYGQKKGYNSGYQKAQADVKAQQEALAKKANDLAAKAANPFQAAANPLQNIADPLEKTKKILNPF